MNWLLSLIVWGLDNKDVIEAAATKWNFIKLSPGLVGALYRHRPLLPTLQIKTTWMTLK
ncbi:MAG: hypothetical protein R2822_11890 [Spirosomataceae bacterium]